MEAHRYDVSLFLGSVGNWKMFSVTLVKAKYVQFISGKAGQQGTTIKQRQSKEAHSKHKASQITVNEGPPALHAAIESILHLGLTDCW